MVRYSKSVSADINKCIHDANIAGFTIENTVKYIEWKIPGIHITRTLIVERKRLLRNQGKHIWNQYKTDDYAYRLEHLQRMEEAKRVKQSAMLQVIRYENDPAKFFQWNKASYVLLEASKYLAELESQVPEIDAIGTMSNGDEHDEIQQEISSIPRTEGNPEAIF